MLVCIINNSFYYYWVFPTPSMQFMNVFTSSAQSPPSARHASLALARSAQGSADSSDWAWDTNSAWKETLLYTLSGLRGWRETWCYHGECDEDYQIWMLTWSSSLASSVPGILLCLFLFSPTDCSVQASIPALYREDTPAAMLSWRWLFYNLKCIYFLAPKEMQENFPI